MHAGASYPQLLVSLVLLGFGSGTSLVPLTSAGLAGVEPGDAGAASGLVNVIQQLGAALGLALLVTVFSAAAGTAQLKAGTGVPTGMVHGLDLTFGVAALFGIATLVMVALLVHLPGADEVGAPAATDPRAGAGAGRGRRIGRRRVRARGRRGLRMVEPGFVA